MADFIHEGKDLGLGQITLPHYTIQFNLENQADKLIWSSSTPRLVLIQCNGGNAELSWTVPGGRNQATVTAQRFTIIIESTTEIRAVVTQQLVGECRVCFN